LQIVPHWVPYKARIELAGWHAESPHKAQRRWYRIISELCAERGRQRWRSA
jgi:hypothetical protein